MLAPSQPIIGGTVADLHRLAETGFRAGAILIDAPLRFVTRSPRGEGRSAVQHYSTMTIKELAALPLAQLAAPDCALFVWTLDWCPRVALELIDAWRFVHKTTAFTWCKTNPSGTGWHFGMGYWTRANPEKCLLATRGRPKRLHADVPQLIVAPVGRHSEKPDEAYRRIERLVGGPYLEFFARRLRPGWTCWGDEVPFVIRR